MGHQGLKIWDSDDTSSIRRKHYNMEAYDPRSVLCTKPLPQISNLNIEYKIQNSSRSISPNYGAYEAYSNGLTSKPWGLLFSTEGV